MFHSWSAGKESSSDLQLLWEYCSRHWSDSWKRFCLDLNLCG